MTNRKWLASLADDEFVEWLIGNEGLNKVKSKWTSTRLGLTDWLKEEHIEFEIGKTVFLASEQAVGGYQK